MNRTTAALGSLVFLVIAPGFVVGVVPWWLCAWQVGPPLLGFTPLRFLGVLVLALGVAGLLDSFAQFVGGLGTPAPIAPPSRLVVTGLYRYVRNPMYVSLVLAIAGQGLLFGSGPVLEYAAFVWLATHLFVLSYEEPHLQATFGAQYDAFKAHVPRWIPRLRPWQPGE